MAALADMESEKVAAETKARADTGPEMARLAGTADMAPDLVSGRVFDPVSGWASGPASGPVFDLVSGPVFDLAFDLVSGRVFDLVSGPVSGRAWSH